jgi:purine catabolism regulator
VPLGACNNLLMLPTLANLLALPELRASDPVVLAGRSRLDMPVRWLRVEERPDAADLRDGELLATTEDALSRRPSELRALVVGLNEAGVVGLLVRSAGQGGELPHALAEQARELEFPLVHLRSRIALVAVTEVVHRTILEDEAQRMAAVQMFEPDIAALVRRELDTATVLADLGRTIGRVVVHEDAGRRTISQVPGDAFDREAWHAHARCEHQRAHRRARVLSRPFESNRSAECFWAPITVDGVDRGRIHVLGHSVQDLDAIDAVALERTAHAISVALASPAAVGVAPLEAGAALLQDLHAGLLDDEDQLRRRIRGLGVHIRGEIGLGMVFVGRPDRAPGDETAGKLILEVDAWARSCGHAVVAAVQDHGIGFLILPEGQAGDPTEWGRIERDVATTINAVLPGGLAAGIGSVGTLQHLRESLVQAQVAAEHARLLHARRVQRFDSLGPERLFVPLVASGRVGEFVEQSLGPILSAEVSARKSTIDALRALLDSAGRASESARELGIDRRTLQRRRAEIERLLGVDFDRSDHRLTLSAALLCLPLVTQDDRV